MLSSIIVGSCARKAIRTRADDPRRPMAVSSGRRSRDLWVRPDGWRSYHAIHRTPQVSVLMHPQPLAADPPLDSIAIRFPDIMVTEKELRAAMSSVGADIFAKVVDWTATSDERRVPATIGFFVELASDQGIASRISFSFASRSCTTFLFSTLDITLQSPISHSRRNVCSTNCYEQTAISLSASQTTFSANLPFDSSDLEHLVIFGS